MSTITPISTLFRKRRQLVALRGGLYSRCSAPEDIERFQVQQFNQMWTRCLAEVPFYQAWRDESALPRSISSTAELQAFPVLDKGTITRRDQEIFQHGKISSAYLTGGGTGEPTRYPRGAIDAAIRYADTYMTRNWSGVEPLEKCLLIWGHGHLFGSGVRGRLRRFHRAAADRAVNIRRLSAYELTEPAMARHYAALVRHRPSYLIGYTSAVFQLARFIQNNDLPVDSVALKAVVITSETASRTDVETIERVFGTRVAIEYGSAETGVVASSRGATFPLQVLWASHICSIGPGGALRVTTLAPRLFPLINYAIGDNVQIGAGTQSSVLAISRIEGRQQDCVSVRTSAGVPLTFSAILLVHILKCYPQVLAVQCRQHPTGLDLYLKADSPLSMDHVKRFFTSELRREYPDFDDRSVRFEQVAEMVRSPAGKHIMVLP